MDLQREDEQDEQEQRKNEDNPRGDGEDLNLIENEESNDNNNNEIGNWKKEIKKNQHPSSSKTKRNRSEEDEKKEKIHGEDDDDDDGGSRDMKKERSKHHKDSGDYENSDSTHKSIEIVACEREHEENGTQDPWNIENGYDAWDVEKRNPEEKNTANSRSKDKDDRFNYLFENFQNEARGVGGDGEEDDIDEFEDSDDENPQVDFDAEDDNLFSSHNYDQDPNLNNDYKDDDEKTNSNKNNNNNESNSNETYNYNNKNDNNSNAANNSAGSSSFDKRNNPEREIRLMLPNCKENYNSTLRNHLRSLINQKQFSDITFFVGPDRQEVYAHKCMLIKSNYFNSMFCIGLLTEKFSLNDTFRSEFINLFYLCVDIYIYIYIGMIESNCSEITKENITADTFLRILGSEKLAFRIFLFPEKRLKIFFYFP